MDAVKEPLSRIPYGSHTFLHPLKRPCQNETTLTDFIALFVQSHNPPYHPSSLVKVPL
jgi:hypothetical protein